jgi:hypothetical protein
LIGFTNHGTTTSDGPGRGAAPGGRIWLGTRGR